MEPAKQIMQCLERSKDIAKELDMSHYKEYANVLIEVSGLISKGKHEDTKAALALSSEGRKIWCYASNESIHYKTRPSGSDDGKNIIFRDVNQAKAPRILGPNMTCNCPKYISHCALFPH